MKCAFPWGGKPWRRRRLSVVWWRWRIGREYRAVLASHLCFIRNIQCSQTRFCCRLYTTAMTQSHLWINNPPFLLTFYVMHMAVEICAAFIFLCVLMSDAEGRLIICLYVVTTIDQEYIMCDWKLRVSFSKKEKGNTMITTILKNVC